MKSIRRWLLPESIEDLLPPEAWQVEQLRRRLLDDFRSHGYELVAPPLLEYVDSLLTGSGRDMDLRTFKLVDQISGRTMGLRADITPQVARIDAHLLNRSGVARLCYCGSVLHTLPSGLLATREPLQVGAELYGYGGPEADSEILRLLVRALGLAGIATTRIDLGHIGLFRALAAGAALHVELQEDVFSALQGKDLPGLRELLADVAEPFRSALLALPEFAGGIDVLDMAESRLPRLPEIAQSLAQLRTLAKVLGDLPLSFDLADLRGYHYYSGVFFAAYCQRHPGTIALGGRYDKVGEAFGRGRAATGFSMDLRQVVRVIDAPPQQGALLAPWNDDPALAAVVERLREKGEVVVGALPDQKDWSETNCDRQLVWRDGEWRIDIIGKA